LTAVTIGNSNLEMQLLIHGFKDGLIKDGNPILNKSGHMIGLEVNKILRFIDIQNFRPEENLSDLVQSMFNEKLEFPCVSQLLSFYPQLQKESFVTKISKTNFCLLIIF